MIRDRRVLRMTAAQAVVLGIVLALERRYPVEEDEPIPNRLALALAAFLRAPS